MLSGSLLPSQLVHAQTREVVGKGGKGKGGRGSHYKPEEKDGYTLVN